MTVVGIGHGNGCYVAQAVGENYRSRAMFDYMSSSLLDIMLDIELDLEQATDKLKDFRLRHYFVWDRVVFL